MRETYFGTAITINSHRLDIILTCIKLKFRPHNEVTGRERERESGKMGVRKAVADTMVLYMDLSDRTMVVITRYEQ